MDSDVSSESSTSAFEDFLSGKQTHDSMQGAVSVVVPPTDSGSEIERIVVNIHAELTHQVRSEAIAVLPGGMTVRARGNVGEFSYQPDVIVDADLPPLGTLAARSPQVIFEVSAAGSERASFIAQWQIYRALPTLGVYGLIDSARMAVTLLRQVGGTWNAETFNDSDDQLFLPTIHCLLSLKTIYAGVFPEEEGEG